ncbi:MAG TPA: cytochrome c [Planctomycetes bacterium]|nr:cytochrome c [Planctomycetota bacterium]
MGTVRAGLLSAPRSEGGLNMTPHRLSRLVCLGVLCMATVTLTAQQDTDEFFKQNCTSCHTIGGGRLTGPDLKNVEKRRDRAWLIRFIQDPQAMIASGDPEAQKLLREARGVVMPKVVGITKKRAAKILDLIAAESKLEKSRFAGLSLSDRPFTEEDRTIGRELFLGTRRLKGGGPPCLSCHTVNGVGGLGGGELGPDLTDAYARLEGRKVLGAWLASPSTETMAPVFKKHPIDPDEILPLLAFLETESKEGTPATTGSNINFVLLGVVGATALLFLFDYFWRRRFTGVRARLVRGQR